MKFDLKLYFQENKPLYIQISDSIINSISLKKLKLGDRIPSINHLSEEHLLSRDTVEKAYKELMKKGIITSVKGKGYYINRVDVEKKLRILLIFNKLSTYKKQIYDSIIHTLGSNTTIDLSVHHSNIDIFSSIINKNAGSYDYYMIMPHFYTDNEKAAEIIKQLPKEKVVILDKKLTDPACSYACVYQDFEKDIFEALKDGFPLIQRYKKLILVFPKLVPYPAEIAKGFKLFCIYNTFDFSIIHGIEAFSQINKGDVYIVIEETDLANLIKICRQSHLKPGHDIGIISYNDTPLKEILLEGITVISTDHELMGRTAATLILENKCTNIKNPFSLIRRNSL
ncbi:GntR family transcriptional regulator [Rubrolithibacter danxiaensis]|uniref:GntR family transcriptional regulator n=1 Tax=Rubrolithibacter danxiaensis TaxID=3390805 RepID=UPI003BF7F34C